MLIVACLLSGAARAVSTTKVPKCVPSATNPMQAAACLTINTLHQTWYNPLSASWSNTQFWGSGVALQATIDFTERFNDLTFVPLIDAVMKVHSKDLIELKGVGSYDDMQWWALAYINAGRLLNDTAKVEEGRGIFDHVIAQALDNTTCGGGVFWAHDKTGFHYKNAITNELAIRNAILLHSLLPLDTHYLQLAQSLWAWFEHSGIINMGTGLVGDGLQASNPKDKEQCTGTGGSCCPRLRGCCQGYYSYNQGVILGALAGLFAATSDEALLVAGTHIANKTLELMVTAEGVLEEPEAIISQDSSLFKGVFMQNLALFANALGRSRTIAPTLRTTYQQFIARSAQSATSKAMTSDYQFGSLWEGPVDRQAPACKQPSKLPCGNATGATPQVSALLLLIAAPHTVYK